MNRSAYAFKMMSRNIAGIEKYIKGAASGKEPEALHQFRVGARRLRNSLSLFKKLFPKTIVAEWDIELRRVIHETSEARDLDVYSNFLTAYANTVRRRVEKNVILGTIRDLADKREKKQKRIIKTIKKLADKRLFEKMKERLNVTVKNFGRKDTRIYSFCKGKVLSRVKDVFDYEEFISRPECKSELHKLRIKNKHLRYTLEGIRELYDLRMDEFANKVIDLHHLLGDIHDYDVWAARIEGMINENNIRKDEFEVLNGLKYYCDEQRNKAYQDFIIQWNEAKLGRFFERMLEYVYSFQGEGS